MSEGSECERDAQDVEMPVLASQSSAMEMLATASLDLEHEHEIFRLMRTNLKALHELVESSSEQANGKVHAVQSTHHQEISALNREIVKWRDKLSQTETKMHSLEQSTRESMHELTNKHRREIRKYVELIGERQSEIESLKKNAGVLSSRLLTLKGQNQSLIQAKSSLELTITKSIEQIKTNAKQMSTNIDENDLDRIVLENKFKQLLDFSEDSQKKYSQLQEVRKSLENRNATIKKKYIAAEAECMELKFEVEKYKLKETQHAKQHQLHTKNNTICENNQLQNNESQLIDKLVPLMQSLVTNRNKIDDLRTLSQNICNVQQLQQHNKTLQKQLADKQQRINQLQVTINGEKFDEILLRRQPSILEMLQAKKAEICSFQEKVLQIQNFVKDKEECIEKIFNRFAHGVQPNFSSQNCQTNLNNAQPSNLNNSQSLNMNSVEPSNLNNTYRQKQSDNPPHSYVKQLKANQQLIEQQQSRIKQLSANNQSLAYENHKLQQLYCMYKNELGQMIENYEQPRPKGTKPTHKSRKKVRCPICYFGFEKRKSSKCGNCGKKMHDVCLEQHDCQAETRQHDDMSVCSEFTQL